MEYGLTQLGSGEAGLFGANPLFKTSTMDLLSDQGFMDYAAKNSIDVNSLAPEALQDLGIKFKDQGGTFNVDTTNSAGLGATDSIGFNNKTLGSVASLGQLGLGVLNYKDSHARNKQDLEGAKFNLAQAREDAAVDARYRASYT